MTWLTIPNLPAQAEASWTMDRKSREVGKKIRPVEVNFWFPKLQRRVHLLTILGSRSHSPLQSRAMHEIAVGDFAMCHVGTRQVKLCASMFVCVPSLS
jgi:hypothetical protein